MEKQRDFEELKNEIFEFFNFDKVKKAMNAVNWLWGYGETAHIPDVPELKVAALELLKEAYEKGTTRVSGGFEASYKNGVLILKFVFDRWEAYRDE